MSISRSSRSVSLVLALLAAAPLVAAGCGSEAGDSKRGSGADAVDTTEERVAPDDQPDPDLEVVPGSGIAGVKVGDSAEDVERVLGTPEDRSEGIGEISGQREQRLRFRDGTLEVLLGEDVYQVETTNDGSRTDSGVGMGSSLDDVQEAYPDVECEEGGKLRICSLGAKEAGEVVTDFFVDEEEVTRIVVGRIID